MAHQKQLKKGVHTLTELLRNDIDVATCLREIAAGKYDIGIYLRELMLHAKAHALLAWYHQHDLAQCKHWAYVAAKLRCLLFKHWPYDSYHVYDLLMALVSDCAPLIDWMAALDSPFSRDGFYSNPRRTSDPTKSDFTDYNVLLALRGAWGPLRERSERLLQIDSPRCNNYRADHRFFLGLAAGDRTAMESAIAELVEPRLMARRTYDDESSATRSFLCTNAIVYAKIATRHGHAIEVDSPWIPAPWLPSLPLDTYSDPYPFMRIFEVPRPLRAIS